MSQTDLRIALLLALLTFGIVFAEPYLPPVLRQANRLIMTLGALWVTFFVYVLAARFLISAV